LWFNIFLLVCTLIGTAQLLTFRTNESGCIDVDVSADGKMLLVSLLEHLYSFPVTGGL
jgi:hypothetical protein